MSLAGRRVVVTGASGLVGGRLRAELRALGAELVLVSRAARPGEHEQERWIAWEDLPAAVDGAHAVVHLAGAPVAGRRWSAAVKEEIRRSRTETSAQVAAAIAGAAARPEVLVQASAVGWYGDRGDELLDEGAAPGQGFLAQVCREWEAAAEPATAAGARTVLLRIGVVLDPAGGALKTLIPLFQLGLGGPLAGGRQWMPWIHAEDLVGLILAALQEPAYAGPVNAVAPTPVTNAVFSKALGRALSRPAVLPAPGFALKLVFGEGAQVVLNSQRAIPAAAQSAGWQPRFVELDAALADLLG